MTVKEAILKSLEQFTEPKNSVEITDYIISNGYYEFKEAKTPHGTVSAQCGDFVRNGDTRVKRIKEKGIYFYYLAKNEQNIDMDSFEQIQNEPMKKNAKIEKEKVFVPPPKNDEIKTLVSKTILICCVCNDNSASERNYSFITFLITFPVSVCKVTKYVPLGKLLIFTELTAFSLFNNSFPCRSMIS